MNVESIRDVMVKGPYISDPEMTVQEALIYMKECSIRHLPIMQGDDLVGIVSERDLRTVHESHPHKQIKHVMVTDPYVVPAHRRVDEIVFYMAKKKLGSALVVDNTGHLVGIFTTIDALYLLYELLNRTPTASDYVEPMTLRELFLAA